MKRLSVFKTLHYPASVIFQNHLNILTGLINAFCFENKDFHWGIVVNSKRIPSTDSLAKKFLEKNEPEELRYYVATNKDESELIISIQDGISISISHGSYELYGLFGLLQDACSTMESPYIFVFLRRYWLAALLVAGMVIPILLILLAGGGWWALLWVLVGGGIEAMIIFWAILDVNDWGDYFLSTKIRYGDYNTKTIGIFASIFGTAKGLISVFASLATIITFGIFIASKL